MNPFNTFLLALSFVVCTSTATPGDSVRIAELEAKVAVFEKEKLEKERQELTAKLAKIDALTKEVAKLSLRQSDPIDAQWLSYAGTKVHKSIWFSLLGNVLLAVGSFQVGNEDNQGAGPILLVGGVALNIVGVVQAYQSGTYLKRAANP